MMVEGLNRLKRKLTKTIPEAVVSETVKAMEEGAGEVVAMMRRLAPVDRTGHRDTSRPRLRDTINWTWGDAPKGAMVLGRSRSASNGLRITIYAGDETTMVGGRSQFQLARLQEFGTQHMAANPYFFPSWRALRKRAKGKITRRMRKAIKDGAR